MAKRFTDTNKWNKPEFSEYTWKQKLIWIYLCDSCDHAGIWDINLKLISFHIGENVSLKEITDLFGTKITMLGNKISINGFVEFQYGELNEKNQVHRSVLKRLETLGIQPLPSPCPAPKDKDKEKDKDKAKAMDKEKEKDKEQDLTDRLAFIETLKKEAEQKKIKNIVKLKDCF